MGSSLLQWESDPLFSAAEVVQDSADRMESILRLLLHEQTHVQGDHSDQRLLTTIEFHKRDLATILETAKWQLEDFERAVNLSAMMDKSHAREDVIFRHKQFIRAIMEQINHVEKILEDQSIGESVKSSEWINLNEQDRDGLALFLSGGNLTEHVNRNDLNGSNILRRFLDPATASSSNDAGLVQKSSEIEELDMGGVAHDDSYYDSVKDGNSRKVGLDAVDSFQENSCNINVEDGRWDLEGSGVNAKSFFLENQSRGYSNRMNIFGLVNNLWTAFGSRFARDYTKRLKDGDEEGHSPLYIDGSHAVQGQHMGISLVAGGCNFQRLFSGFLTKVMRLHNRLGACDVVPYHIPRNKLSIQIILTTLFALIVLGILLFLIA